MVGVWILLEEVIYYNYKIKAVYGSKEKAERARDRIIREERKGLWTPDYGLKIEEWEVI